jgi:hypothetical protein
MRVIAGLGAVLFAYLALIPGGLVFATLDNSCDGCGEDLAVAIVLTAAYVLCFLGLLVAALSLARYALHPGSEEGSRVGTALAIAAALTGLTLFALFVVAFPIGGVAIAAIGAGLYLWLRARPGPPDPRSNGHGRA